MEFLRSMLECQYGKELSEKVFAGLNVRRAVSFRTNRLKADTEEIKQELSRAGLEFLQPKWSEDAFIVKKSKERDLRELPIYEDGKIYLQSLSSQLPPIILAPRDEADILDMAAAPGGKTTQLAALSQNKAHITACERNRIRAERLKYNLKKQGANSVLVLTQDARRLDDVFSFDQILLDAPCSGSGTLDLRNERQITKFTPELIEKSLSLQASLLKKACRLLKRGGELVYSTCSILARENEENVLRILGEGMELLPISFYGADELPALPSKIHGTLCIAPDEFYEGFFIAKLRKIK